MCVGVEDFCDVNELWFDGVNVCYCVEVDEEEIYVCNEGDF